MNWTAFSAISGLVVVFFGAVWGIVRALVKRDRDMQDQQIKALWTRVDGARNDLLRLRGEYELLKFQISALPDGKQLYGMFKELEDKFERRLDKLAEDLKDSLKQMSEHFRCEGGR